MLEVNSTNIARHVHGMVWPLKVKKILIYIAGQKDTTLENVKKCKLL